MSWEKTGDQVGAERGITEGGGLAPAERRDPAAGTMQLDGSAVHSIAPSGTVRWARVLELRAAIQDGSYRVPAEEVADSMLRFARRQHSATLWMYPA